YLSLGFLDLASGFVQRAALAQLFVSAAPCCHLPNHFAAIMLGTLLDAGITRIGADNVFLAMQQLVDLGDVPHVSRRTYHAMHQARFVIDADVGLHAKVILVALLGLVHLWVALAVFVLGRT